MQVNFTFDKAAVERQGHGDDFACMWDVVLSLLRSDALPAELLPPPVLKEQQKKRKVPER